MAATKAPTPQAKNINPNWLTVEYAKTLLISFWARPMVAAINAVANPITATTVMEIGARTYKALQRETI